MRMIVLDMEKELYEAQTCKKDLIKATHGERREWILSKDGPTAVTICGRYPLFGRCFETVSFVKHEF